MTVQAEDIRVTYDADGVTTDFAFEFKIFAEGDIDVILTDDEGNETTLTITDDYTVSDSNGSFESGGTISTVKEVDGVMVAYAWADGYTITIVLNLDLSQETDLPYGANYKSETIETMVDKLTKICQQLDDAIARTIILTANSALSGLTIPDLEAGKYLYAVDATTLGWATSVDATAITVSAYGKTLIDDLNAAAAQTTLGISAYIKTLLDDATSAATLKTLLSMFHTSIAKTATYTVTTADRGKLINFDCTTGHLVADLPAAATAGNGFAVALKKTDATANYLTADPNAAELIDGGASYIIRGANDFLVLVCDGTGWKIVGKGNSSYLNLNSITDHGILLGSGTGAITPTAAMSDAQLLVGQTGADPLPKTLTGDVTITAAGVTAIGGTKVLEAMIGTSAVAQGKLKTSQGSVSQACVTANETTTTQFTLPGGEYGFDIQGKYSGTNFTSGAVNKTMTTITTSYVTAVLLSIRSDAGAGTCTIYAQQRYVTSSGEVFWIFILRDKVTKDIISMYQAPDHPCFGNGGKPLIVSHPFGSYDPSKHEIIVINPSDEDVYDMEEACIIDDETKPDKDILEIVLENYEIDEDLQTEWPKKEITVGLPKGHDWKRMAEGSKVTPVKKRLPQPEFITTRRLYKK